MSHGALGGGSGGGGRPACRFRRSHSALLYGFWRFGGGRLCRRRPTVAGSWPPVLWSTRSSSSFILQQPFTDACYDPAAVPIRLRPCSKLFWCDYVLLPSPNMFCCHRQNIHNLPDLRRSSRPTCNAARVGGFAKREEWVGACFVHGFYARVLRSAVAATLFSTAVPPCRAFNTNKLWVINTEVVEAASMAVSSAPNTQHRSLTPTPVPCKTRRVGVRASSRTSVPDGRTLWELSQRKNGRRRPLCGK